MYNQIVQPSDVARMLRDKTLPGEWDIWEGEGEFAASKSQPLASNPYLPETLAWYAWTRGWKSASVGIRIGNAFGAVIKLFIVAALILAIVFWIIPYSNKSWVFSLLSVAAAVWYVAGRLRGRKAKTPDEERAMYVEWLGEMCDFHKEGTRDCSSTIRRQIEWIENDYDACKVLFPDLDVRLRAARALLELPPESDFQWYYVDAGNTVGPVAHAELTQYLITHGFNVFVWRDGQNDWLRASDVPELSSPREPPPPTSRPNTDAPVPFSPNLPDVTIVAASRAFRSNSYLALFVKDAKPCAARLGEGSAVNYPYVLVVVNDKIGPIYYVTLETTVFGTKAMGVFDTTGIHQNCGFDDLLNDEQAFIDKAIALVQDKFGERFQESPPVGTKNGSDW